jgi:hypothetical protein
MWSLLHRISLRHSNKTSVIDEQRVCLLGWLVYSCLMTVLTTALMYILYPSKTHDHHIFCTGICAKLQASQQLCRVARDGTAAGSGSGDARRLEAQQLAEQQQQQCVPRI